MAIEVEIKAHCARPEETRRALDERAVFRGEFLREDFYLRLPGAGRANRDLRIRRESGRSVCTFKKKSIRAGLEINEETEFALGDENAFRALLAFLGCEPLIEKTKRGRSYDWRGLTVDLCEVPPLGWFVEVEALLDAGSGIEAAEREIRAVLGELALADSEIEERTYMEMLRREEGING